MAKSAKSSDQQPGDGRHSGDDDSPAASMTTDSKHSTSSSKNRGTDGGLKTFLLCVSEWCADFYFPRRYVVVLLLFVGFCTIHAQRANIGVVVVYIVDARHRLASAEGVDVPNEFATDSLAHIHWDSHMIGWLHAIFYVGLFISQVPCGYFATRLPSHTLFGGCLLLAHSLNFLLPLSIERIGYAFTCIVRLTQGLIEGMVYPSCYDVLRHWTVPEERSRAGTTVLTGSYIGPTLGTIASGMLNHHLGWQYVFYAHGGAGLVFFFVWILAVYEKPSVHPRISTDECKMIEAKQGEAAIIYDHDSVPWKAIFTSLPVYALIVCNFARSFVFYMMLTNEPAYLNVFQFSLDKIGLFSSLPYVFMGVFALTSGMVADCLNIRDWTTLTAIRKLFTCSGFGLSAVFFFALASVESRLLAVVFLTAAVGCSGIAIAGWQINHLDLAPRYAGVLVGITMTAGTLAGVINPLVVAAFVKQHTINEWHHVFLLTGCVLAFSVLFYFMFGSGERQSWACPSVPNVTLVDNSSLMKGKPYGTFEQQVKHTPAENGVKTPRLDDRSSKPSSDDLTSNNVADTDNTKHLDADTVDGATERPKSDTAADSSGS